MKQFFLLMVLTFTLGVYAQTDFQIVCGPYLQRVSDTEATIMWLTNKDAVSWVDVAPDDSTHFFATERPHYFQTRIGKKVVGTTHAVRLKGLNPGTFYRYRIHSQEVLGGIGQSTLYGKIVASKIFQSTPLQFKTLDTQKTDFSFVTVNDIHENNELLNSLLKDVKKEKVDFVIYNGDMVSDMRSPDKITNGFLTKSAELFATEIPFYIARGNHETRGLSAKDYMDFFPSKTGEPYYSFQQGNTFFIILDSGEDKPDSNIEYGGLAAFDEFRMEQQKWLKELVNSDACKAAKHKIVIVHMPPMPNHWHGPTMVKNLYVPILNEAGIDLMLCGHLHKHLFYENNYGGCQFPVLINSNKNKLRVDVSDEGLVVKAFNEQNKPEFEVKLK